MADNDAPSSTTRTTTTTTSSNAVVRRLIHQSRSSGPPSKRVKALLHLKSAFRAKPNEPMLCDSFSHLFSSLEPLIRDKSSDVRRESASALGLLAAITMDETGDEFSNLFIEKLNAAAAAPRATTASIMLLTSFVEHGRHNKTISKHLPLIVSKVHRALEHTDSVSIVRSCLNCLRVLLPQFRSHITPVFEDVVDLCVGWVLDQSLPFPEAEKILDSFSSFGPLWNSKASFTTALLNTLVTDMESMVAKRDGGESSSLSSKGTSQMMRFTGCISAIVGSISAPGLIRSLDMIPRVFLSVFAVSTNDPRWAMHVGSILLVLARCVPAHYSPFSSRSVAYMLAHITPTTLSTALVSTLKCVLHLHSASKSPATADALLHRKSPIFSLRHHHDRDVLSFIKDIFHALLSSECDLTAEKAYRVVADEAIKAFREIRRSSSSVARAGRDAESWVHVLCFDLLVLVKAATEWCGHRTESHHAMADAADVRSKDVASTECGGGRTRLRHVRRLLLHIVCSPATLMAAPRLQHAVASALRALPPQFAHLSVGRGDGDDGDILGGECAMVSVPPSLMTNEEGLMEEETNGSMEDTYVAGHHHSPLDDDDGPLCGQDARRRRWRGAQGWNNMLRETAISYCNGDSRRLAIRMLGLQWVVELVARKRVRLSTSHMRSVFRCVMAVLSQEDERHLSHLLRVFSNASSRGHPENDGGTNHLVIHPRDALRVVQEVVGRLLGHKRAQLRSIGADLLAVLCPSMLHPDMIHNMDGPVFCVWKRVFMLSSGSRDVIKKHHFRSFFRWIEQDLSGASSRPTGGAGGGGVAGPESFAQGGVEYLEWVQSVYSSCRVRSVVMKEELAVDTDVGRPEAPGEGGGESLFWLVWNAARFCISHKLYTHFGNPVQTFQRLEKLLMAAARSGAHVRGGRHGLRILLQFVDHLEKQMYCVYEGSLTLSRYALPGASQSAFFRGNRKVCEDWYARMRQPMVEACGIAGAGAHSIRHATLRLRDLRILGLRLVGAKEQELDRPRPSAPKEFRQLSNDLEVALQAMAMALWYEGDCDALCGLEAYSRQLNRELHRGLPNVVGAWLPAMVLHSRGALEAATKSYRSLLGLSEAPGAPSHGVPSCTSPTAMRFATRMLSACYSELEDWEAYQSCRLELESLRARMAHADDIDGHSDVDWGALSRTIVTPPDVQHYLSALSAYDLGHLSQCRSFLDRCSVSHTESGGGDVEDALLRSDTMLLRHLSGAEEDSGRKHNWLQEAKTGLYHLLHTLSGPAEGASLECALPLIFQLQYLHAVEKSDFSSLSPRILGRIPRRAPDDDDDYDGKGGGWLGYERMRLSGRMVRASTMHKVRRVLEHCANSGGSTSKRARQCIPAFHVEFARYARRSGNFALARSLLAKASLGPPCSTNHGVDASRDDDDDAPQKETDDGAHPFSISLESAKLSYALGDRLDGIVQLASIASTVSSSRALEDMRSVVRDEGEMWMAHSHAIRHTSRERASHAYAKLGAWAGKQRSLLARNPSVLLALADSFEGLSCATRLAHAAASPIGSDDTAACLRENGGWVDRFTQGCFEQAVEEDPCNAWAWYQLGCWSYRQGHHKMAEENAGERAQQLDDASLLQSFLFSSEQRIVLRNMIDRLHGHGISSSPSNHQTGDTFHVKVDREIIVGDGGGEGDITTTTTTSTSAVDTNEDHASLPTAMGDDGDHGDVADASPRPSVLDDAVNAVLSVYRSALESQPLSSYVSPESGDGLDAMRGALERSLPGELSCATTVVVDHVVDHWCSAVKKHVLHHTLRSVDAYFRYIRLSYSCSSFEKACDGGGDSTRGVDAAPAYSSNKRERAAARMTATLRLLRALVRHGGLIGAEMSKGFDETPAFPWKDIVPQLFSRIGHADAFVRQQVCALLSKVGAEYPHLVAYPAIVGATDASSTEEERGRFVRLQQHLASHSPQLVREATLVVQELTRISMLWEERWALALKEVHRDVRRRIRHMKEEISRVRLRRRRRHAHREPGGAAPRAGADDVLIEEKYRVIMEPAVVRLRRLMQPVVSGAAHTEHEKRFIRVYGDAMEHAFEAFRHPSDPSEPELAWAPWKQLMDAFDGFLRTANPPISLSLHHISPSLAKQRPLSLLMPGVGPAGGIGPSSLGEGPSSSSSSSSSGDAVRIHAFQAEVLILPSKTKPKRITLVGSDGKTYAYLLKGREDLHLDERMMQFLHVVNQMLRDDKEARLRRLQARSYAVIPLGPRAGLIQWVEKTVPLFLIHKSHARRQAAMRSRKPEARDERHHHHHHHGAKKRRNASTSSTASTSSASLAAAGARKPIDCFFDKLAPALKKAGVATDVRARKDWPRAVLKEVFQELCKETPRWLIAREIWCSSASTSEWWHKSQRYNRSAAVMSMIGYIIGLGDRHLDNVLMDVTTGELVHIDYNVCFEKGLRLRVPETVPFRMTQNMRYALGLTGVEGSFRSACEQVLRTMRRSREILLTLLEAFVYDPLVDWTADVADAMERKRMELNVALNLFASHLDEARPALTRNRPALVRDLPAVHSELDAFHAAHQAKCAAQRRHDAAVHALECAVREAHASGAARAHAEDAHRQAAHAARNAHLALRKCRASVGALAASELAGKVREEDALVFSLMDPTRRSELARLAHAGASSTARVDSLSIGCAQADESSAAHARHEAREAVERAREAHAAFVESEAMEVDFAVKKLLEYGTRLSSMGLSSYARTGMVHHWKRLIELAEAEGDAVMDNVRLNDVGGAWGTKRITSRGGGEDGRDDDDDNDDDNDGGDDGKYALAVDVDQSVGTKSLGDERMVGDESIGGAHSGVHRASQVRWLSQHVHGQHRRAIVDRWHRLVRFRARHRMALRRLCSSSSSSSSYADDDDDGPSSNVGRHRGDAHSVAAIRRVREDAALGASSKLHKMHHRNVHRSLHGGPTASTAGACPTIVWRAEARILARLQPVADAMAAVAGALGDGGGPRSRVHQLVCAVERVMGHVGLVRELWAGVESSCSEEIGRGGLMRATHAVLEVAGMHANAHHCVAALARAVSSLDNGPMRECVEVIGVADAVEREVARVDAAHARREAAVTAAGEHAKELARARAVVTQLASVPRERMHWEQVDELYSAHQLASQYVAECEAKHEDARHQVTRLDEEIAHGESALHTLQRSFDATLAACARGGHALQALNRLFQPVARANSVVHASMRTTSAAATEDGDEMYAPEHEAMACDGVCAASERFVTTEKIRVFGRVLRRVQALCAGHQDDDDDDDDDDDGSPPMDSVGDVWPCVDDGRASVAHVGVSLSFTAHATTAMSDPLVLPNGGEEGHLHAGGPSSRNADQLNAQTFGAVDIGASDWEATHARGIRAMEEFRLGRRHRQEEDASRGTSLADGQGAAPHRGDPSSEALLDRPQRGGQAQRWSLPLESDMDEEHCPEDAEGLQPHGPVLQYAAQYCSQVLAPMVRHLSHKFVHKRARALRCGASKAVAARGPPGLVPPDRTADGLLCDELHRLPTGELCPFQDISGALLDGARAGLDVQRGGGGDAVAALLDEFFRVNGSCARAVADAQRRDAEVSFIRSLVKRSEEAIVRYAWLHDVERWARGSADGRARMASNGSSIDETIGADLEGAASEDGLEGVPRDRLWKSNVLLGMKDAIGRLERVDSMGARAEAAMLGAEEALARCIPLSTHRPRGGSAYARARSDRAAREAELGKTRGRVRGLLHAVLRLEASRASLPPAQGDRLARQFGQYWDGVEQLKRAGIEVDRWSKSLWSAKARAQDAHRAVSKCKAMERETHQTLRSIVPEYQSNATRLRAPLHRVNEGYRVEASFVAETAALLRPIISLADELEWVEHVGVLARSLGAKQERLVSCLGRLLDDSFSLLDSESSRSDKAPQTTTVVERAGRVASSDGVGKAPGDLLKASGAERNNQDNMDDRDNDDDDGAMVTASKRRHVSPLDIARAMENVSDHLELFSKAAAAAARVKHPSKIGDDVGMDGNGGGRRVGEDAKEDDDDGDDSKEDDDGNPLGSISDGGDIDDVGFDALGPTLLEGYTAEEVERIVSGEGLVAFVDLEADVRQVHDGAVGECDAHSHRNVHAVRVLKRVKEKLEGRAISMHPREVEDAAGKQGERMTVAQQVNATIAAAISPDNLCELYEGWTAWI